MLIRVFQFASYFHISYCNYGHTMEDLNAESPKIIAVKNIQIY